MWKHSECTEPLVRMIDQFKTCSQHELEFRIGRMVDGAFRPGVPARFFAQFDALLGSSRTIRSGQPQQTHVFYHRGPTGAALRTEVAFESEGLLVRPRTIEKVRLACVTIDMGAHAARITLSKEVPTARVVPIVDTVHVRIRNRTGHAYTGKSDAPFVRYDMTKTWSGRTKSDAERRQRADQTPAHELECEMLHNRVYMQESSADLAASFLAKLGDVAERVHSSEDAEVRPSSSWKVVVEGCPARAPA